ncbi:Sulfate permease 1 [Saccharomyces cerevisiae]|nr:Sul1p [Saccharomyces cerevisiae YJM555]AJQ07157.1 Sul1p [Saccharomyces cerevisiae YJM682]AJQ09087.1 Sul1p [Saccharomyces cerevisiae YJM1304]AJQ09472.1 Sul1p [Saccharomyces cerevisiae YJM1307]AJQ16716.1 Sul1p [Saccharomyces cerevisiae YJM1401]CAI4289437.1 ALH_1c_G0004950.mRNA.1.CDS.1 [Saccharomyces cerevisiae]
MSRKSSTEYVHNQEDADIEVFESEYRTYRESEAAENRDGLRNGDEENWKVNSSKQKFGVTKNELSDVLYDSIPAYEESTVTLKEYYDHSIKNNLTAKSAGSYLVSLFPIIKWFPHYNFTWGYADLVAGITVGCVLVPQSMSYAQIASLSPEYGLYSSFIGAFIYSLFATSKDVCIGPVAVMSLQTAKVIAEVLKKYPEDQTEVTAPIIATTLCLLCGIVATGLGILRLGFLVELISLNAVAGFMTGSAFNIIWGQIPALMGYNSLVNTREATYKVVINTLKHLPNTKLDAVFGLIPLVILYVWKWWCGTFGITLADRYYRNQPKVANRLKSFYFYAQAMRNAVVIVVFTAISWSITRNKSSKDRPISILGTVPSGLNEVGVMKIPDGLLSNMSSEIPASIIVLVLEHIAISKSFGRINDYKVVPDQELIAIGVTNLIGTFFHSYPATGSFSRSALKAKCNVRTPFSGVFTGGCVLLALYCLTDAFFFIPKATLSAVIIHAVSDLLTSYKTTWTFWKTNPLDCISFIVTVFITVFSSIENGIYFAMCWSCAMLLLKQAFPAGKFLGRVEVAEVLNPTVQEDIDAVISSNELPNELNKQVKSTVEVLPAPEYKFSVKWVPFDHGYSRELNINTTVRPPPPGVIVYRLGDSFTYVNCSRHYDIIFDRIKEETRRGQLITLRKKSDRPWNDPGEWKMPDSLKSLFKFKRHSATTNSDLPVSNGSSNGETYEKPLLKVVCLDFSQVAQVDSTAVQSLVDLRKAVNRYADRQVEFHFAGIISPWIKRSLLSVKFGTTNEEYSDDSIIAGHSSFHVAKVLKDDVDYTDEDSRISTSYSNYETLCAATGTNLPFFHIDIPDFSKWDV